MSALRKLISRKPWEERFTLDEIKLQIGKTLPKNKQLEVVVLGALIIDSYAYAKHERLLEDHELMAEPKHQTILFAMKRLFDKGKPIDMETVLNEIRIMNLFSDFGDGEKLNTKSTTKLLYEVTPFDMTQLTNKVISSANLEHHLMILHQLRVRRIMIESNHEIAIKARDLSQDIFKLVDYYRERINIPNTKSLFRIETMNQAMDRGQEAPKRLNIFGNLIREKEVVIGFGDPGTGKTLFFLQVGDAASKGELVFKGVKQFTNETKPKKVGIFDFELDEADLFERYSEDEVRQIMEEQSLKSKYKFSENFKRITLDDDFDDLESLDKRILPEIIKTINEEEMEIAIIDNLTYITEEAGDSQIAIRIMKKLKRLVKKSERQLSVIVIAHTPKRDQSLPVEQRHLSGSKNLVNFCQSLIAISPSHLDPSKKYIKLLKKRGAPNMYDGNNVIECNIDKKSAFLGFEFQGTGNEQKHLQTIDWSEKMEDIMQFCLQNYDSQKCGWRKLAKLLKDEFGTSWSYGTVRRKYENWLRDQPSTETYEELTA